MGKYLITGRSGTGKTTLWHEMLSRNLNAFDGDKVPGLAGWTDLSSGLRIDKDYPGDDHLGKFTWDWDDQSMHALLADNEDLFLCGNADNSLDFYGLFDRVFILTLPALVQRQRIMARSEHDYGKDQKIQESIILGQKELVEKALELGAIAIDASPPTNQVLDSILLRI